MIQISNCPISGLERKLTYDFIWLQGNKQIIVRCFISHYSGSELINNARIKNYQRDLIASDSLVDASRSGWVLSQSEINNHNTKLQEIATYEEYLVEYPTLVSNYSSSLTTYNTQYDNFLSSSIIYSASLGSSSLFNFQPFPPVQPIPPAVPQNPGTSSIVPMHEYDFYAYVLGVTPLILPNLIESIIISRDLEGKFNI